MADTYHQLGRIAQARRQLEEAKDWYRRAVVIGEELGDLPGMVKIYGQLAVLADEQQQQRGALHWTVRTVTLVDQFPHPLTESSAQLMGIFAGELGMPTLEEIWQQVTGRPVPQPVRDYASSYYDDFLRRVRESSRR